MLRMDEVNVVRYKALVEGQSIRRVAREMGMSRNTVRKYLSQCAMNREHGQGRCWRRWSPGSISCWRNGVHAQPLGGCSKQDRLLHPPSSGSLAADSISN